eukprot:m.21174 g.21174  ORF g.21174 m.21174 type:complete len:599 (-) comp5330_c0_seq1:2074-3870(-)
MSLTPNAIEDILDGKEPVNPVLQVLHIKKISANSNKADRYRLTVSDGISKHTSAMLATQLNDIIVNEDVAVNGLLRLKKYMSNTVSDRKIMILLQVDILEKDVGHVIGNPSGKKSGGVKSEESGSKLAPSSTSSSSATAPSKNNNPYKSPPKMKTGPVSDMKGVTPIANLHPYLQRWTILARCASKPVRREWNNQNGHGCLFSVDLVDNSGAIRATSFKETCDRLLPLFEQGQVYLIKGGTLKLANPRFNTLGNEYEMTFDSNTTVTLDTSHTAEIPQQKFNFKSFQDLENTPVSKDAQAYVDVLSICHTVGDLDSITTKNSGQQLSKRDVVLLDKDSVTLNCTFWGEDAEKFEENGGEEGCVVAIKGGRLSDFNGRSLSVGRNSGVFFNIDLPEAHTLKGWYDAEGAQRDTKSITVRNQNFSAPRILLSQIKDDQIGMQDGKQESFSVVATITHFKKDNCMYQACPSDSCNKKVIENGPGEFHCEKCGRTYENFQWRLMLQMSIADCSGQQWCTAFQDTAETLLGCSANELGQLKESDEGAFNQKFLDADFKTWKFVCRARSDTYQDEMRVRVSVSSAKEVDYLEEVNELLKQIDLY